MKKIMFKDKYGLTQAVLAGQKTMTRRIVPIGLYNQTDWKAVTEGDYEAVVDGEGYYHDIRNCGEYRVGEVVAIAQNYKDAGWDADILQEAYVKKPTLFPDLDECEMSGIIDLPLKYHKGWTNKMFVKADLMPHHIKITDIKVERMQDISDEDCLKEGIVKERVSLDGQPEDLYSYTGNNTPRLLRTSREAFAALIDKISGKGTWNRNPFVFVYEFELNNDTARHCGKEQHERTDE